MSAPQEMEFKPRVPGPIGMQARATRSSTSGGPEVQADLPVRVVLVGQTGLDLPLRLDPTIELRRVATAVHAVGEAAESAELAGGGAAAVTIVLAPEIEPRQEAEEFLRGVRRVCPGVRVLRLLASHEHHGSAGPGAYDGTIGFGTAPEEIRRLVRAVHASGGAPEVRGEPLEEPAAASVPMPRPAPSAGRAQAGPTAATGADPGEADLVRAVLMGRDLVLPALDVIRRRTGCADVSYVGVGEGGAGVEVAHEGVVYGRLAAPALAEGVLREHGAWLGQWMALRQQQEDLRQAAFTDELTGAWNRRYCDRFLGAAIGQSAAARRSVTVMYFDIDNFKQYNDRYGHGAGDDILRETVRLLQSVIRPTDRVCRVGGDEFVVVFHEPEGPREVGSRPPATVAEIAARFQRQICERRFPKLGPDAPGTLTISGGLATFPWDGRSAAELVDKADQLAMQSKLQGKNAITFGPGAIRVCGRSAGQPTT